MASQGERPNRSFSQRINPMAKTKLIGRSAITGRFKPVAAARRQKDTSVVERVKVTKKKGR